MFQIFGSGLHALAERKKRRYFLSLLGVLLADVGLTAIDPYFTRWVGHDFARDLLELEGSFVARIQSATAFFPVQAFFVWIYVLVYPLLMLHLLLVLHHEQSHLALRRFWWAFVLNYTLALPFYFFFPVTEVGWVEGSGAVPILETYFPSFMAQGRQFSGIDNCFPSLHTSLSVTAALVAQGGKNRRLATVCWLAASGIVLSTLVLGIHWGMDLIAGIGHAWLCVWLAKRLAGSPLPYSSR